MNALVLNGASKGEREWPLKSIYDVLIAELMDFGCRVNQFILQDMVIAYCAGCLGCWVKTPGSCKVKDGIDDIVSAAVQSDLLVFFTPVTFGGYSSLLKRAVDRLGILFAEPQLIEMGGEFHHRLRYKKKYSIIGIGVAPQPDYESEYIFKSLVGRNAVNLNNPNYACGVVLYGQDEKAVKEILRKLLKEVK